MAFSDSNIVKEDFSNLFSRYKKRLIGLRKKTIMITGATGLIGKYLVSFLQYLNTKDYDINIYCSVRDVEKAKKYFGNDAYIRYVLGDILNIELKDISLDYIVHTASPTASSFFASNPVEIYSLTTSWIFRLLELAKINSVARFVYLSSMEVYGYPKRGELVNEKNSWSFDSRNPRNSYPISKQLCEAICNSYHVEYNIPTTILRLTQTFGPGVDINDKRFFALLLKSVINKEDIVLKSKGKTERSYLYLSDAVAAILLSLVSNKTIGETYSVANPTTYCSIKQMANLVCSLWPNDDIKVVFKIDKSATQIYADTLYMNLDVSKLKKIGWKPYYDLPEMFTRMAAYCKEN